ALHVCGRGSLLSPDARARGAVPRCFTRVLPQLRDQGARHQVRWIGSETGGGCARRDPEAGSGLGAQLALQERPLGGVLTQLERALPRLASERGLTELVQQLRSCGMEQVIAVQRDG